MSQIMKIINRGSGKALDVHKPDINSNGAKVQQWNYGGGNNQLWVVNNEGSGRFSIKNYGSGKALDVHNPDINDNGAKVHQWDYHGNNNQLWTVEDLNGGWGSIKNRASGKALDVHNPDINNNGAKVQQWDHHGGPNQQWQLIAVDVPDPDNRVARRAKDEMEFSVKVSRTGIVETRRYAGIKKQSGTYHHYFWFTIVDDNEDTVWVMGDPLKLTIGAALDTWGNPSFVSKTEYKSFNIPTALAQQLAKIAIFLERKKGGSGSILDQLDEADKTWKRLKDNDLVSDFIKLAVAQPG